MLLKLENVSKTYSAEVPVSVLSDVCMELTAQGIAAIVGPSGSGKSTLLNTIGALTGVDAGTIQFKENDISLLNPEQMAQYRNQDIGFVFQQHFLLPQMSLLENALMPTLAFHQKVNADELRQRAIKLLDRVGLIKRQDHRPGQCSGGECQRAAVVRALINSPELILADEPTGSLDQASAENLTELLLELNQEEGVAFIIVTHSSDLVKKIDDKYSLVNGSLGRI